MYVGSKESRSYTTAFLLKLYRNMPVDEESQAEYVEELRERRGK